MHFADLYRAVALAPILIAVVISLLINGVRLTEVLGRKVEWPCTDRSAIQWIRHPEDCAKYYICHFGQPLSMPDCPFGQVWGINAKNCVPEHSRWNDCNLKASTVKSRAENEQGDDTKHVPTKRPKKYRPVAMSTTPDFVAKTVDFTKPPTTSSKSLMTTPITTPLSVVITFGNITDVPARKSHKVTPVVQNDYGKSVPPGVLRKPVKGEEEKPVARHPTAISPFHPYPMGKHYTYLVETKKEKVVKKTKGKHSNQPLTPKKTSPTTTPLTTALPSTQGTVNTLPSIVRTVAVPRASIAWERIPQEIQRIENMYGAPRTTPRPTATTVSQNHSISTVPAFARPIPTPETTLQTKTITTQPATTTIPITSPTLTTLPITSLTLTTLPRTSPMLTTLSATTVTNPTTTPTTAPRLTQRQEGRRHDFSTSGPTDGWAIKPMQLRLSADHPCHASLGHLAGHPKQCHWYYNCTVAALENLGGHLTALEEECRYPQLFDLHTGRCREFINVKCQGRFEPVDPCEYQGLQCRSANCVPCNNRYGTCRGRDNGIYPFHTNRWTPTFVTCYQQRNIAQDDCQPPTPIFSPDARDCVALFDVPKPNGGLRPDCTFKEDGFYPDEQGRCGIFFECRDHEFGGYDECPSGTVFDPMTLRCQLLDRSTPPCGEGQNPSCSDRQDGFHADPFGRCPYYFECRKNQFVRHLTCDFGSFDPRTQECIIPTELILRPCGLLPNSCEGKPSGFYPDENSNCHHYVECSKGVMISNGTCPTGAVFSAISGRCDRPENAPEPCGLAPSCSKKPDGRYSALTRGCSFYFECRKERFAGLKQCTIEDGGFFFNEKTGKCDFPQNICPPCGYRWWGCPRAFYR